MASATKTPPGETVTSLAASATKDSSEAMPEIVVTGHPIPWYVWAVGGILAGLVLVEFTRRGRN